MPAALTRNESSGCVIALVRFYGIVVPRRVANVLGLLTMLFNGLSTVEVTAQANEEVYYYRYAPDLHLQGWGAACLVPAVRPHRSGKGRLGQYLVGPLGEGESWLVLPAGT